MFHSRTLPPPRHRLAGTPGLRAPVAIQALSAGAALASWIYVPLYADTLGATPWQLGVLTGGFAVAGFVAFLIFGRASDMHGRRPFVHWGLAISAVLFALCALADTLWTLLLLRVLGGFAAGIFPAALIAYVQEQGGRLGRFAAFGSLGWGLGTLLGGGLVWYCDDPQAIFPFSGVLFALALLVSLRLPPVEGQRIQLPLFPTAVIRRNAGVFAALLLRHAGANAVWLFWPLFLVDKGASYLWVGVIMAANMAVQFLVMYFISDRVRPLLALRVGLALTAFAFAAFWLSPDYRYVLAAQVVLGTSWGFTYVGSLRCVAEGAVEKATASGMLQATLGLAGMVGPFVGAVVVQHTGDYEAALVVGMAAALAALALSSRITVGRD